MRRPHVGMNIHTVEERLGPLLPIDAREISPEGDADDAAVGGGAREEAGEQHPSGAVAAANGVPEHPQEPDVALRAQFRKPEPLQVGLVPELPVPNRQPEDVGMLRPKGPSASVSGSRRADEVPILPPGPPGRRVVLVHRAPRRAAVHGPQHADPRARRIADQFIVMSPVEHGRGSGLDRTPNQVDPKGAHTPRAHPRKFGLARIVRRDHAIESAGGRGVGAGWDGEADRQGRRDDEAPQSVHGLRAAHTAADDVPPWMPGWLELIWALFARRWRLPPRTIS